MTEQITPLADPKVWLWRSVEAASLASLAADGAHRAAIALERACGDHLDARQQAFLACDRFRLRRLLRRR